MRCLLCCLLVWGFSHLALAQPDSAWYQHAEPVAYGQLNPSWLDLTSYPPDSQADALIIADMGRAAIEWLGSKQVVSYTVHRRVKILTEAGLAAARFSLRYPSAARNFTRFEAASYGLNAEGEVVQFKVDRRAMREEVVDRRYREVAFDFPLVKVGSVIEYRYSYYTDQLNVLEPWIFQHPYPVLHSEFHLVLPATHQYQRVPQGDLRNLVMLEEPVQLQDQRQIDHYPSFFQQRGRLGFDDQPYPSMQAGTRQVFLMRRIPAVSSELLSNPSLLPGLRFQLAGTARGDGVEGVFRNWRQLNRHAQRQLRRRKLHLKRRYVEQTARRLTRNVSGQLLKAEVIYRWVREQVAWDGTYDWQPQRLDRVLKNGEGNSASLNMLAILLMQEAGLNVHPVLLSTRSNGPVQMVAANLGQFNHLIGGLRINGTERLFDVLSDLDEMGVLPREDINQAGYWLTDEGGEWVRLRSHNQIVRFTYSRFTLNEEGLLTGDITVTNQSYSAARERERAAQVNLQTQPEAYLRRSVLTGMESPKVMSYQVENLTETGQPLTVSCTLQTRDFVRQIGDLIMITPLMTKQVAENPFAEKDRAAPVDLTYPLRESHLLGLRIPNGYEVAQMPQPIRVMLPNDAGLFVFNTMEMGDILHVSSCIFLNQTVFLPNEYQGIRTFFDYIVRKHAEDIVLKRKEGSE